MNFPIEPLANLFTRRSLYRIGYFHRAYRFSFPAFNRASRLEKELDCTSAASNSARAEQELKMSNGRTSDNEDDPSFENFGLTRLGFNS